MPDVTDSTSVLLLAANDWVPNNPYLPVLIYRQIFIPDESAVQTAQQLFEKNGWPAQWVDGIYPYHHYHSNAHEVLAVARGDALLMLGGPEGQEVAVRGGDIVLLPAGTGHCNLRSSDDFTVVGAYPPDQQFDLCRGAPTQQMLDAIAKAPFPHRDPVYGNAGPLTDYWIKI
ncbi:cupin [Pseudescherichia sp.]|uniref:cupin n=1 Tax=Pseudescherichia sp. TaxID=2055881 RepID=UPI00289A32EA|nr:cupin [Pseudescherichia sp.]